MTAVNILALLNTFGQLPQQLLIFLDSARNIKMYVCTVFASFMSNISSVDDISHVTHIFM